MSTEMTSPPQPPDQAKKKSIFGLIVGLFTSPGSTFESYAAHPSFLVPFILLLVLAGLSSMALAPFSAQTNYDIMKHATMLPAEQLEVMKAQIDNPAYINSFLMPPIFITIIGVLAALLVWFIAGFIMGGSQVKFMTIWGVGVLGGFIGTLGNLLVIPLIYAKGTLYFTLGLGAVLPNPTFTSFLYLFFYFLNFFAMWGVYVTGIGYSKIFGISVGKGVTTAIITTVLFTLLGVGLQVLGMSMVGVETTFM